MINAFQDNVHALSLPSRGAWIEIDYSSKRRVRYLESLPSRGAWIEMSNVDVVSNKIVGRSPRGERGLKYGHYNTDIIYDSSLPSRGAWIEMPVKVDLQTKIKVAPLAGSVD